MTGLLSAPMVLGLLISAPGALAHSLLEYGSFLALLGALFVVAGGIHVGGDWLATPARNTGLLALGGVLANAIGTTGASMLLIRVMLRSNSQREKVRHCCSGARPLLVGPKAAREANRFSFAPIGEVAILFGGIFVTMVPALALLGTHASALGLSRPWHYFVVSGALSSVLDNAPTYPTFLTVLQSLHLPNEVVGVPHAFLAAISLGAVLKGANTYVGNGPNFMVKASSDQAGYHTAFARHAAWALFALSPVYLFAAVWLSY